MQEICQSGSEGGAKTKFVPTPISDQAWYSGGRWRTALKTICDSRARAGYVGSTQITAPP